MGVTHGENKRKKEGSAGESVMATQVIERWMALSQKGVREMIPCRRAEGRNMVFFLLVEMRLRVPATEEQNVDCRSRRRRRWC